MSHWFKMEFKFNDYVKVLRKAEIEDYGNMPCAWNDEYMDRTIGKTGRIVNIENGCVEVEFTGKYDSWWFPTTVLEKVEKQEMKEYPEHHSKLGFFVGDRVKMKDHPDNFPEFFEEHITWDNCWMFDMNNYIGKEGVITCDSGRSGLEIDFNDGHIKFRFPYFCLEKVEEQEMKEYPADHSTVGFFVGDRVKVKDHPVNFPDFKYERASWCNSWASNMDKYIGKEGVITCDSERSGLEIDFNDGKITYRFPYFCLEKVNKEKKNTGIVIKTEKIVDRGRQMYKVIRIKALSSNQLPFYYMKEAPYCYKRNNELCLFNKGMMKNIVEGCQYSKTDVDEFIKVIRECGDRLMKINQELKEANKDWHGEEIFTI